MAETPAPGPQAAPTRQLFAAGEESAPPDDLVTVAVSLYNYARFLPECLDSILRQTHAALDLIVVDDASSEEASPILARDWAARHAGRFASVKVLRHMRNEGLAQARNTAFAAARADPVFVLDADNALYPRAAARLLEAMRGGDFAAAYCQLEHFGDRSGLGLADVWRRESFKRGNYVDAMALVSRRAWMAVGGYLPTYGWEDYDFWCKFVEAGLTAIYVPEILCRYRVHGASMLHTATSHARTVEEMMQRHPWLELRG